LIRNIFNQLNAKILRVEVVALRDDTFFGNIVVEFNGRTLEIDSRPSDALAIAVRAHVPILVEKSVMDSAGITPEEDLQDQKPEAASQPDETESEDGDERLSVFQDFLEGLDLDDIDSEDDDNPEK
jgi:bifunctional DNase/RNase